MAADKTPLHSIVSVICDALHDLSPDDQARALEAARVSLGLRAPVVAPVPGQRDYGETAPRLPRVEVEMTGSGLPMVVNPPPSRPPGRALVLVDPQRRGNLRPQQLPRPPEPEVGADGQPVRRGYVRSLRG